MTALMQYVQDVPNWPIPGVTFKDISPLLADNEAFQIALKAMRFDFAPDYWVGIESRGFIFASAMAQKFGGGFLMVRKKGKLPPPVMSETYSLEYGSDTIVMKKGSGSVVIVDDVLATGGTLMAAYDLCIKSGYSVLGSTVLIELDHLKGRERLKESSLHHSVLNIPGE